MTESEATPKRRRRSVQPEQMSPGLYLVDRFGERYDVTGDAWLGMVSDVDLAVLLAYLEATRVRALRIQQQRELGYAREMARQLDLSDVQPAEFLERRVKQANGAVPAPEHYDVPTVELLERVRDGLAENLAADPDVKAVMDATVADHEQHRDEAVARLSEAEELPPEIAARVDEALADPSKYVKYDRAQREARRAEARAGGRSPQPWDNDADEDPWRGVEGA